MQDWEVSRSFRFRSLAAFQSPCDVHAIMSKPFRFTYHLSLRFRVLRILQSPVPPWSLEMLLSVSLSEQKKSFLMLT